MAGYRVILGCLVWLAPFACDIHVLELIGAPVFEGYDVLQGPVVAGPELALADVALAPAQSENVGSLLWSEVLSGLMLERVGHGSALCCVVTIQPFRLCSGSRRHPLSHRKLCLKRRNASGGQRVGIMASVA